MRRDNVLYLFSSPTACEKRVDSNNPTTFKFFYAVAYKLDIFCCYFVAHTRILVPFDNGPTVVKQRHNLGG